jgi:hypothetical protein
MGTYRVSNRREEGNAMTQTYDGEESGSSSSNDRVIVHPDLVSLLQRQRRKV